MVALSMADGYARLTSKPQCVIIHVDVGTQGLGAAVHDSSTGRCPVLIFAGLSPFTLEGEMRGSRTEYIHWIQDVPDQKQIISQYCRYTAEIKTGKNVKQMVNRALGFAMSDPKGPVHLVGAREVMEEDIQPYRLKQEFWTPVEPAALPAAGVRLVAEALVSAKEPLVVTGYSGRNHKAPGALTALADSIPGLRVLDTGGSDMCFPASHRGWLGLKYGNDDAIRNADVILVLDCDVPWIPTQCRPNADAKIYHIDVDVLKKMMPVAYIDAIARYSADAYTAISQINEYISSTSSLQSTLQSPEYKQRWEALGEAYASRLKSIADLAKPSSDGNISIAYLAKTLRDAIPDNTIFAVEAVTSSLIIADQIQATRPGSWINCGGGGLGWSGGGSLGIKLASMGPDYHPMASSGSSTTSTNGTANGSEKQDSPFIVQIVGDGTYLFSVPSSVYWIQQRYNLPTLTIVLNNNGWNAPKKSALLVHPEGYASTASNGELNISFAPGPDYAGIAKAAAGGKLWAGRTHKADELGRMLGEAIESVKGGVGAVLEAQLDGSEGKYVMKIEGNM